MWGSVPLWLPAKGLVEVLVGLPKQPLLLKREEKRKNITSTQYQLACSAYIYIYIYDFAAVFSPIDGDIRDIWTKYLAAIKLGPSKRK